MCRGGQFDPTNPSEDLETLTVLKIKEMCKAAGLPTSGKKADLIQALQAYRQG